MFNYLQKGTDTSGPQVQVKVSTCRGQFSGIKQRKILILGKKFPMSTEIFPSQSLRLKVLCHGGGRDLYFQTLCTECIIRLNEQHISTMFVDLKNRLQDCTVG